MAIYDREASRFVARVVYDGPPRAGKTTNLKELCRFFSTERRSELYTPAEREGRTLYFDWLQVECGYVDGRPLRCQLVSVPGQQEFAVRRSRLLRDADAVVFVCESEPDEVRRARPGFAMLREFLARAGRPDVPIIVQANKQDLPGALPAEGVLDALGARASGPVVGVVPACASLGDGVREAMVLAVRAISASLQNAAQLEGEAATAAGLLREIVDADGQSDGAPESPGVSAASAERPARAAHEPPLPDADVAVGCVWPALGGREVLRRVAAERTFSRDTPISLAARAPGDPRPRVYHAGRWRLATAPRLRFATLDDGRAALRAHAHRRQLLGTLLAPESVLALQGTPEGAWWLWMVSPQRATLQADMVRASARRDEAALGAALGAFGEAAVQVTALAQWHQIAVDLHPSNFVSPGAGAEALCLDEFVENDAPEIELASALLQRVDEYARWPAALEQYLGAVERAVVLARGRGCDLSPLARGALNAPAHSSATRSARAWLAGLLGGAAQARVAT